MLARKNISQIDIDDTLKKRLEDWKTEITKIDNSITGGNIWREWNDYCYKIRNKIIHRSHMPNQQEAEKAIKTGQNLINLFNQKV